MWIEFTCSILANLSPVLVLADRYFAVDCSDVYCTIIDFPLLAGKWRRYEIVMKPQFTWLLIFGTVCPYSIFCLSNYIFRGRIAIGRIFLERNCNCGDYLSCWIVIYWKRSQLLENFRSEIHFLSSIHTYIHFILNTCIYFIYFI